MTKGLNVSHPVSHGVVRRRCGTDGFWVRDDSGQVWRDMTQCEEEEEVTSQEVSNQNVSSLVVNLLQPEALFITQYLY